ncbi:hypothetical protein BDV96DRAFT_600480 [Lophiotrema nucula]|uniref:Uncharacterized protein n=1 Tax=Lophiotrema nucula TaxID=690887 RepID=A0A6A5Z511_9PLEO|nr:hypothetical protein BDV96DRAFT_600480 [Lophiotrema nucula]
MSSNCDLSPVPTPENHVPESPPSFPRAELDKLPEKSEEQVANTTSSYKANCNPEFTEKSEEEYQYIPSVAVPESKGVVEEVVESSPWYLRSLDVCRRIPRSIITKRATRRKARKEKVDCVAIILAMIGFTLMGIGITLAIVLSTRKYRS